MLGNSVLASKCRDDAGEWDWWPMVGIGWGFPGLEGWRGPPPTSNWAGGDALRGIGKLLNCSWDDIPVALIQQALANFFGVATSLWV